MDNTQIVKTGLKLITENDFHDYDIVVEQENSTSPKFMKVRGPYIVMDAKNANGRYYPKRMMMPVVEKFIGTMIKNHRALGELNHPSHTDIDQERACHKITKLTEEKNVWIGESIVLTSSADGKILGTPCGDILASLLQHGCKIGMSTRGVGNIKESGEVEDYTIVTEDVVSNPSGPGCFVNGILESKQFVVNVHGEIYEAVYDAFENKLKNIPTHSTKTDEGKAYMIEIMRQFIKSI